MPLFNTQNITSLEPESHLGPF
uniref:Uncharacterized protein n=1 Tax=Anguilla anguilla TaxID=7936 RepID=A0A0E9V1V5_ANGAN